MFCANVITIPPDAGFAVERATLHLCRHKLVYFYTARRRLPGSGAVKFDPKQQILAWPFRQFNLSTITGIGFCRASAREDFCARECQRCLRAQIVAATSDKNPHDSHHAGFSDCKTPARRHAAGARGLT
jgi:hypothetical protein